MPHTTEPMTQTIAASEARQQFSQLLNQVFRREKRIVIEKSGVPVAALVSADDLEQLRRFEEQRREDFAVLDRAHRAGVDIDVGVELEHGDLVALGVQQQAEAGGDDALADAADVAAGDENVLGHGDYTSAGGHPA